MKKILKTFNIFIIILGVIIGIDLLSNYTKMQSKQLETIKEANEELKKDLNYEEMYELEQKKNFSVVFGMGNFIIYTSLFLILILGFRLGYDKMNSFIRDEESEE